MSSKEKRPAPAALQDKHQKTKRPTGRNRRASQQKESNTMKKEITNEMIEAAGHDIDDAAQIRALCAFLDCEPGDLERESYENYGLAVYSCGRMEYAIGTDDEADSAAKENIKESLWAFNASFLASYTDLPQEVFDALQPQCEGANDAITKLVERSGEGIDGLVAEAISADGRGHFLSSYDGNENEEGEFYIYRTN